MRRRLAILLLGPLLITGCDRAAEQKPSAQEIPPDAVAEFCGMGIGEHPGPKAEIFVRGRARPYWFASVRDMFAFTLLPEEPKDITAIYVTDMARARAWDQPGPGIWIDARAAVFVIGSRAHGGMDTNEAVPFAAEAQARAFAAREGGRVVTFAAMPPDYILPHFAGAAAPDGGEP